METRGTTGAPGPAEEPRRPEQPGRVEQPWLATEPWRAEQPWRARACLPISQVERFLTEGMPGTAIAHSYHVEALLEPALQADANFMRFSLIELNELHHQVAAMGACLRHRQGDPTAVENLAVNLAGFLQNRQAANEAARSFGPQVTSNPAMQRVLHLVEQSNREIERNMPTFQQFTSMVPAGVPGAMLVHC